MLKLRFIILSSTILLLTIISFINPTAKERVFDQTLKQMIGNEERKQGEDYMFIFSKTHTHHYITGYKMYLDNKILGVGVKNFRNFCSDERYEVSKLSCSSHPHNTYIQVLSETGIIGFLFLITLLIYFCKYMLKHLFLKFKQKYYFTDLKISKIIFLFKF